MYVSELITTHSLLDPPMLGSYNCLLSTVYQLCPLTCIREIFFVIKPDLLLALPSNMHHVILWAHYHQFVISLSHKFGSSNSFWAHFHPTFSSSDHRLVTWNQWAQNRQLFISYAHQIHYVILSGLIAAHSNMIPPHAWVMKHSIGSYPSILYLLWPSPCSINWFLGPSPLTLY